MISQKLELTVHFDSSFIISAEGRGDMTRKMPK